jgi:hypothetical protein
MASDKRESVEALSAPVMSSTFVLDCQVAIVAVTKPWKAMSVCANVALNVPTRVTTSTFVLSITLVLW